MIVKRVFIFSTLSEVRGRMHRNVSLYRNLVQSVMSLENIS